MKYINSNGDWFAAEEAGKKDAKEAVHIRAFLVDLEFAKTDRFFSAEEVAVQLAKAPENKISISFKTPGSQPVSLELYAAEDSPDKFLVKRSGTALIYRVPKSVFNSMRPSVGKEGAGVPEAVEMPVSTDEDPEMGPAELDAPNG